MSRLNSVAEGGVVRRSAFLISPGGLMRLAACALPFVLVTALAGSASAQDPQSPQDPPPDPMAPAEPAAEDEPLVIHDQTGPPVVVEQYNPGAPPPPGYGYGPGAPPPPPPPLPPLESERARHTIHIEGLGAGLLWSINYEHLLHEDFGVRAGLGSFSLSASAGSSSAKARYTFIPITAHYLAGPGRRNLELMAGMSLAFFGGSAESGSLVSSGSAATVFGVFGLGYRLHPRGPAGMNFRVGMMALVNRHLDVGQGGWVPWPYVSLGASF